MALCGLLESPVASWGFLGIPAVSQGLVADVSGVSCGLLGLLRFHAGPSGAFCVPAGSRRPSQASLDPWRPPVPPETLGGPRKPLRPPQAPGSPRRPPQASCGLSLLRPAGAYCGLQGPPGASWGLLPNK